MPKTIGKYEILNTLGSGAMGVVYRARDPIIDRIVAIKVLSPSLVENARQRDRFYQEARTAGRLRHPNIVVIYDCGEDQGVPYIVMEYLEGEDLRDLIGGGEIGWSLERKLDFLSQICRGLSHAHQKDVVHRDMKPGNMRVLPDGSAKIMDFGIARLSDSTQTQTGAILGTVAYMAPEQCQSAQVTAATDIWSVGVVLFELLTGHRPFAADNNIAVIHKIVSENPPPLSRYLPDCPPELETIVSRALAKEPATRYQRVDDLLTDIEKLLLKIRLESPAERPLTMPGRQSAIEPDARNQESISITEEVHRAAACIETGQYDEAENLIDRLSETDADPVIVSSLRASLLQRREPAGAVPEPPKQVEPAEPKQFPATFQEPPSIPDRIVRHGPAETDLELPGPRDLAPAPQKPASERIAPTEIRPATRAIPTPRLPSETGDRSGRTSRGRRLLVVLAGVAALAVIGLVLFRVVPLVNLTSPRTAQDVGPKTVAPTQVTEAVSLNVLPWAEILEVTEKASGRKLPELTGSFTPIHLNLPKGEYLFRVRNRVIARELSFSVSVTSGQPLELTKSFPDYDPKAAVTEFGIQ